MILMRFSVLFFVCNICICRTNVVLSPLMIFLVMTLITFLLATRNLRRRKSRTVIALLGIILATSLFIGVNLTVSSLSYTLAASYTDFVGDFDILIYGNSQATLFNPSNLTRVVENISDVSVAVPRLIFRSVIYTNSSSQGVLVVGINQSVDDNIGSFKDVEGSLSLGTNETLILRRVAQALHIKVSENITLTHFNFNTSRFENSTLTVKGIVDQNGKLPLSMRLVIFTRIDTLSKLLGVNTSANFLFVKVNSSIIDYNDLDSTLNRLVDVSSRIQLAVGLDYKVTLTKGNIYERISTQMATQQMMLNIFVFISILMAAILVVSTMFMSINERIHEFGVLRSVGLSRLQIFKEVIYEALFIGVLGSIIGIIIGIIIGNYVLLPIFGVSAGHRPLHYLSTNLVHINATASFNISYLLFAFIIGLVTSILAGLYPAYITAKLLPIEALSPAARKTRELEHNIKHIAPDRVNTTLVLFGILIFIFTSFLQFYVPLIRFYTTQSVLTSIYFVSLGLLLIGLIISLTGALPFLVKVFSKTTRIFRQLDSILASRNLIRYRRRTALTFFMLTTSIAFIILIGSITASYSSNAQVTIQYETGSDIVIYLNEQVPLSITENITKVEGVMAAVPITKPLIVRAGDLIMWRQYTLRIYGINVTTFFDSVYHERIICEGNPYETINGLTQSNTSIVISSGLAKALNLKVNDLLRIETSNRVEIMNISGLARAIPGFFFTGFTQKAASTDALVSLESYQNLTGGVLPIDKILVRIDAGADAFAVANDINSLLSTEYDIQIITTQELIQNTQETYNKVFQIFATLLSFAIIIAVLGHTTALVTSVSERIWETGVLRSIGLLRNEVISIFIFEAFFLTSISFISGLLTSIIIVVETITLTNLMSDIPLSIVVPTDLILSLYLLIVFVGIISSYLLTKRVTSVSIVTALRKGSRL